MINRNNKNTCQLTNDINKSVIIITVNIYLKFFKALLSFRKLFKTWQVFMIPRL